MNAAAVSTAKSQLCLKRLLDEPSEGLPRCKQARVAAQQPVGNIAIPPCLQPSSPAAKPSLGQLPSRVGRYLLLERCEGEDTYKAEHVHTKQQYTCQVVPLRGYQERLAAYVRVGQHANVCSLRDVVVGPDSVYVFLQGHHGNMHAYLRSKKRLSEEEAGRLFAQVLAAVAHCHEHGVVLRDLKLRRFVFTDEHRTHLALLGLNDSVVLSDSEDDSLTDRHGCPAYVSPELLTNGKGSYAGRAADVWSLGVSLYTMLVGRYPFQDTQPAVLFAKIRRGAYSLPDWLSPRARCLVGCMLRKSPCERLRASELLMHPWLSDARAPYRGAHKATQHAHNPSLRPTQGGGGGGDDGDNQVVPTWNEKTH